MGAFLPCSPCARFSPLQECSSSTPHFFRVNSAPFVSRSARCLPKGVCPSPPQPVSISVLAHNSQRTPDRGTSEWWLLRSQSVDKFCGVHILFSGTYSQCCDATTRGTSATTPAVFGDARGFASLFSSPARHESALALCSGWGKGCFCGASVEGPSSPQMASIQSPSPTTAVLEPSKVAVKRQTPTEAVPTTTVAVNRSFKSRVADFAPKPVGQTLDYEGLKVHASGRISEIFGPVFKPQEPASHSDPNARAAIASWDG